MVHIYFYLLVQYLYIKIYNLRNEVEIQTIKVLKQEMNYTMQYRAVRKSLYWYVQCQCLAFSFAIAGNSMNGLQMDCVNSVCG